MSRAYEFLKGTASVLYQIGGKLGSQIKSVAGGLAIRNPTDSGYSTLAGATPTDPTHFTTKEYVDNQRWYVVTAQFNGNSPLPSNTGTEHWAVVTTSDAGGGSGAMVGDLIWDNGTGVGTAVIILAGNVEIVTAAAFTGGTISFAANQDYFWSVATSTWVNISAQVAGVIYCTKVSVGTTNGSSADSIPANAVIGRADIVIGTSYSVGATITVGRTGSAALLADTTDSYPANPADTYVGPQRTAWGGSALPVLVTVGGSPSVGAADVYVEWTLPLV